MLAAMMLTACIATVKAQTADEILDKHIAAIGGADNWNNLKTVKMVGSLSVQGNGYQAFDTDRMSETGKAMRTDINAMGSNGFIIVTTTTSGYMYLPFQGQTKVDTYEAGNGESLPGQRHWILRSSQLVDYKSKRNEKRSTSEKIRLIIYFATK